MKPEHTLKRAVTLSQKSKCIKIQQPTIREDVLQESTIEVVKGTIMWQYNKKGRIHFHMYRLTTHLVKEQNNCVVAVEGQAGPHNQD